MVRRVASRVLGQGDKQVPIYQPKPEHLRNLQVLPNRILMLDHLPKGGVVAEIGVDRGGFSAEILRATQPRKLHLIDAWGSKRYHLGLQNLVKEKFAEEIANGTVEINKGLSVDMADTFPDAYFDWIYIDTDHTYHTTKKELELYHKKVKPDGYIAGHDFIIGNWNSLIRYGVQEAVYEFCNLYNWEMHLLTLENGDFPSFAIRRMNV